MSFCPVISGGKKRLTVTWSFRSKLEHGGVETRAPPWDKFSVSPSSSLESRDRVIVSRNCFRKRTCCRLSSKGSTGGSPGKRKHCRTRRPFRGVVFKEQGTTLKAKILDVSEGGALLELEEWVHSEQGETACLEIHPPSLTSSESSRPPIKVVGLVTRVEAKKRRLAMAFLDVAALKIPNVQTP